MPLAMTRRSFPSRLADLGFSIDVPEGFIQVDVPRDNVDFENPTQSAPLELFSSQVAMAFIAVAARPAYETGSVLQWLRYLADHFDMQLQHALIREIGSGDTTHPAVTAFATQVQDGQKLHLMIVAFEDGGRLVTAHAMCPAELWASYGSALSAAAESITLTSPKGPTRDVDSLTAEGWGSFAENVSKARAASEKHAEARRSKREVAVERAQAMVNAGHFDEAEQEILKADSSIDGGVEVARLFERRLRFVVRSGAHPRERVEAIFARALRWAQSCYPEPHTQIEADDNAAGREADRARLVAILGYEPQPAA